MMTLPETPLKFIWPFIVKQRIKFAFLALTTFVWAANDAAYPYFLKLIVNKVQSYQGIPSGIYSAVAGVFALLVVFWIISEVFNRAQGFVQIFTFPRFRANIRETVFKYISAHSHDYFSNQFAGNIANKIGDLPMSCQTIMEIIFFQFLPALIFTGLVLITMWLTKPIFAAFVFAWLCLHLLLTILFMRAANQLWSIHADAVSVLSGNLVDIFTNMQNVRMFARKEHELNYIKHYQHDEMKKAKKAMYLNEIMRVGLGLNGLFLIFSMISLLLYGWAHGWVTIGDFTQISMQAFWLLGWLWFISFQLTVFAREMGVISNALTLINKDHDIKDSVDAFPLQVKHGHIQFENVSFNYRKNLPVFNHLTIQIAAGQKVGLVGFSGSGKSTFVNLILRFYDINAGKILIDHQDISKVTQASLHAQIAMIPQDPTLFHRSLIDNIRYGRLDATDEEVIRASKLAHCHEFITKLDDGYQSLVGERGIKLSGGQRQRIAIARAILKNAPILILDEATSSLDSVTEKLIQESLHHLMRDRTTIVIAHRLSTLADMDRILVFDKGQIIEDDTHTHLLEKDGHFAKLWKMQSDGFLPDVAS